MYDFRFYQACIGQTQLVMFILWMMVLDILSRYTEKTTKKLIILFPTFQSLIWYSYAIVIILFSPQSTTVTEKPTIFNAQIPISNDSHQTHYWPFQLHQNFLKCRLCQIGLLLPLREGPWALCGSLPWLPRWVPVHPRLLYMVVLSYCENTIKCEQR